MAQARAREDGTGAHLAFTLPKEGSNITYNAFLIPASAPHPEAAHKFLNFILEPKVIAEITNDIHYGNDNLAARPYVEQEMLDDPAVYPPPAVRARLYLPAELGAGLRPGCAPGYGRASKQGSGGCRRGRLDDRPSRRGDAVFDAIFPGNRLILRRWQQAFETLEMLVCAPIKTVPPRWAVRRLIDGQEISMIGMVARWGHNVLLVPALMIAVFRLIR